GGGAPPRPHRGRDRARARAARGRAPLHHRPAPRARAPVRQRCPRYVRALDAGSATVTVSDAAGLRARGLVAREVSWTGGAAPALDTPLAVRIRHRHPPVPARLARADGADTMVLFE